MIIGWFRRYLGKKKEAEEIWKVLTDTKLPDLAVELENPSLSDEEREKLIDKYIKIRIKELREE